MLGGAEIGFGAPAFADLERHQRVRLLELRGALGDALLELVPGGAELLLDGLQLRDVELDAEPVLRMAVVVPDQRRRRRGTRRPGRRSRSAGTRGSRAGPSRCAGRARPGSAPGRPGAGAPSRCPADRATRRASSRGPFRRGGSRTWSGGRRPARPGRSPRAGSRRARGTSPRRCSARAGRPTARRSRVGCARSSVEPWWQKRLVLGLGYPCGGRVAERTKAAVLKTAYGATRTWVRIPPLPPPPAVVA